MQKRNKYNAKKITLDGIQFDSADECRYYVSLMDMKAKEIVADFIRQPEVLLIESFRLPCGTLQRKVTYTPDFLVIYHDGRQEYVDVKGFSSQQGDLRRKMYNYQVHKQEQVLNIPLRWVSASKKYGDEYGFIDYDLLQKLRRENKKDAKS